MSLVGIFCLRILVGKYILRSKKQKWMAYLTQLESGVGIERASVSSKPLNKGFFTQEFLGK